MVRRVIAGSGTIAAIYLLLWGMTLSAAAVTAAVPGLARTIRASLHLALKPTAARPPAVLGALVLHNLIVSGYPWALGALRLRSTRVGVGFSCAIAAGLAFNAAMVGAAAGAYGAAVLPFLPHLPLEWLALAIGASEWFRAPAARLRSPRAAALLLAVVCAAAFEAYATPHR